MAIVSFNETHLNRREGEQSSADVREYTRRFVVETNSIDDGPDAILSHASCPRYGDPYVAPGGVDILALCHRVRVDSDENNRRLWYVEASYTTDGEVVNVARTRELHPLARPADVQFSFTPMQTPLTLDRDDKAPVNVNGEPFDPPPVADELRLTMVVEKNLAMFFPELWGSYTMPRPAINEDEWAGGAPETWKISRVSAVLTREQWGRETVSFWRVAAEFEYNPREWHMFLLNQGFLVKAKPSASDPPGTVRLVIATDADGNPVTTPVLLSYDGRRLRPDGHGGLMDDNFNLGWANYIHLKPYPKKPFSALGLL